MAFASRQSQNFYPIVFALLLAAQPSSAQAQENDLAANLEQARVALTQLDTLAGSCLSATEADPNLSEAHEACLEFRQALDGQQLISYLTACRESRAWRDDFVARRIESGGDDATSDDAALENLVQIEYWCADNALSQRSDFITAAYSRSRQTERVSTQLTTSLQRELNTYQQQSILAEQQDSLQDNFTQQQRRVRQDTQRLMQDLELELIRQQNEPAFPPRR